MLNPVTDDFLEDLHRFLPVSVFRPLTSAYLEEPRGLYKGQGGVLLAPDGVDQVSLIVAACNRARVGIVPYGGGTGLVVGQLMPDGPAPVILSLERMTAVRAIRPEENLMIVEAGAVLQQIQDAADSADRLFPLSLASEGSCRIGGNLSTNAGGVNVLRYGNARDLCLGIEAVLPDGQIFHGLSRLRKDNTGYDLKNLLIGAEGTLGVITAASLKLFPRPAAEGTALMVVPDPEAALALLSLAAARTGGAVCAFELIHRMGLEFLSETQPDLRQPFAQKPEWMVLIEIGLGPGLGPVEVLTDLFADAFEQELVLDGLIASTRAQRADFWAIRERIPEANKRIGAIASHDISLPLGCIADFIRAGKSAIEGLGEFRVNCFGHLGDGNLHYNVFPPKGDSRDAYLDLRGALTRRVHDLVQDYGGSFSAEHGIGRLKVEELQRYGDPVKLVAMRSIKQVFDPTGIMNPGAVLPQS